MQAINQLEYSYHLLKAGGGDPRECIDWALQRLRNNEEDDDQEIILLAASEEREDVLELAEHVVERYCGYQALDPELAAGKYVVTLRHDYLREVETIRTLYPKLLKLYEHLDCARWLSVLVRNARHARDNVAYREYFEKEFAYLARLWAVATSRAQFEFRYNHAISLRHDAL